MSTCSTAVRTKPVISEPKFKKARTRYGFTDCCGRQIFEIEQHGHHIEKIHAYFLDKSKELPVPGETHWLKGRSIDFVKGEIVHIWSRDVGLIPSKILEFIWMNVPDATALERPSLKLCAQIELLSDENPLHKLVVPIQTLRKAY